MPSHMRQERVNAAPPGQPDAGGAVGPDRRGAVQDLRVETITFTTRPRDARHRHVAKTPGTRRRPAAPNNATGCPRKRFRPIRSLTGQLEPCPV
jgi:hypothetical protein